ncbi:DEAD/DEAH box helicase [Acaryochloris sp. CCMEE 5410]|uniref:DEAD/DEAH box helicase n=1 Tax=Acaryochloris sp. CCMEE 5410 TaxID=310037 RepID=UPI0002483C49|nr:DEAD/DEAH box helicase [Acaryochloris sp. CCMEE 5410]KAI9131427.1 DEAD/DEAH box helicase [Acaryochloris sp. CCMEE 5410]
MTLTFSQLGLSQTRVDCLEALGFTTPTQIQAEAIPHLLAGRDIIGQAQTGTGKTAAFSLPILEQLDPTVKTPQALILTPTRELAVQVSEAIYQFKADGALRVVAIYGGQSIDRQISQLRRGAQLIVGTPGRVLDLLSRGEIVLDQLSWFVLDEADEMLNMGFIPDVRKILERVPGDRKTAFFSATMAPEIYKLSKQFLNDPVTVTVEQPKAAPTRINQVAYRIPRTWARSTVLQAVLELEDPESAIIFVRTRREAATLTQQLQTAGYSADEYHGDLSQSQRERLLDRFRQRRIRWVVATDIAARGLHVDDLSHVINYEPPDSVESYVHRIGRTGRAGNEGTAISLVHALDRWKLHEIEQHIRQEIPTLPTPTRSAIEGRRLEKLTEELHSILTGERLASFLPTVSQLGEDYDTQTIAAAALQMAFDRYPAITANLDDWSSKNKNGGRSSRKAKPVLNKRRSSNRSEISAST